MKAASGKAGGGNNFSIGSPLNTEHFSNMQIQRTDYSSIRGKNVLVSPTEEQYDLLKKRLEERTQDSRGETIYEIGVGEGL